MASLNDVYQVQSHHRLFYLQFCLTWSESLDWSAWPGRCFSFFSKCCWSSIASRMERVCTTLVANTRRRPSVNNLRNSSQPSGEHTWNLSRTFPWSKNVHVEQSCSCGSKLLHIPSTFAPHDTIACHVEQSYAVLMQNLFPFCRNLRTFVWSKI